MNSPLLFPGASSAPALLSLRPVADIHHVRPSDPALRVVTDFSREQPITVAEDRRIDDARGLVSRTRLERQLGETHRSLPSAFE